MLKDEIIVLFLGVVVMIMLAAFSRPWCCNDCALGVVVVMNILFNKFMKIKRERV